MNYSWILHVIRIPKAYPSYIGSYDRFPLLQQFLDQIENLYPNRKKRNASV